MPKRPLGRVQAKPKLHMIDTIRYICKQSQAFLTCSVTAGMAGKSLASPWSKTSSSTHIDTDDALMSGCGRAPV